MIKPLFIENGQVKIIDQTRLPGEYKNITINDHQEMGEAIKRLAIRGAPAIGIAAAYGLVLGLKRSRKSTSGQFFEDLAEIKQHLLATRPTAVNLSWALQEMENCALKYSDLPTPDIWQKLWVKAGEIHKDDIQRCIAIGNNGNLLIKDHMNILTHCNTGGLATGGLGTALGIIITAHQSGKNINVFADETRPLLQGARLTAWELAQVGIHHEICTDSTAGFLMEKGKVDLVIVGADRITKNGDVANKIGTYSLAVLADYHNIPFYVAGPQSTIDSSLDTGQDIPIEYRSELEVKYMGEEQLSPEMTRAITPAFDVTPGKLISGIITERKIYSFPYNFTVFR